MILILRDVIPILLLLTIILAIVRIFYNQCYHKSYTLKDALYLFYILYIFILLYVVTYDGLLTFKPEINLCVFKEILRYKHDHYLFWKNIIGNILLFIPFGSFFKVFFNISQKSLILVTILYSLLIELTQLVIGRVFDIDDILLNVVGSLIGFLLSKKINN